MNTTRTPQQASSDSKDAREAWEAGIEIEVKEIGAAAWQKYSGGSNGVPGFTNPYLLWRVAKPTPAIGPGHWRMRNGEVRTVEQCGDSDTWMSKDRDLCWFSNGNHCENKESPYDLLTRAKTSWRPWRPEEVPLGAKLRSIKDNNIRCLLVWASTEDAFRYFYENERLLTDGTYAPCGVEEVVG